MIGILKFIDNENEQKIFPTVDRIAALTHVSTLMGNYFTSDDSPDPASSVVCQALRVNIDFELFLRSRRGGGTFQSLASAHYNLKSPEDHDLKGDTQSSRRYGSGEETSNTIGSRSCWYFQKHGRWSKQGCRFSYHCSVCGSINHGVKPCILNHGYT